MKRLLACLLAAALCLCTAAAAGESEWNYDQTWGYLNGYSGNGGDVTVPGRPAAYFEDAAPERGLSSSDCELRALEAERGIEDLYMTLYMADRIGEAFDATVISVTKNGMFVSTDQLVEGFVPASAFPVAKTDEEKMTLTVGRRVYTLGSRLRVRLTEADVSARRITFAPVLG